MVSVTEVKKEEESQSEQSQSEQSQSEQSQSEKKISIEPRTDKIVHFQHFHKAGGTTITRLFCNHNKYNAFIPNRNGNPYIYTPNGQKLVYRYDLFNHTQFNRLKKGLNRNNINFICLEWNFFKNFESLNLKNVALITVIRDPYDRYISNMKHDNVSNYSKYKKSTIRYKQNREFPVNVNKSNYYTKILNGLGNLPNSDVTAKHLERAKSRLKKFNSIIILENPESYKLLQKHGVNYTNQHRNKSKHPELKIKGITRKEFIKQNTYDYELYNYAKELSNQQIVSLYS